MSTGAFIVANLLRFNLIAKLPRYFLARPRPIRRARADGRFHSPPNGPPSSFGASKFHRITGGMGGGPAGGRITRTNV
jgi:hypothetical protein